MGDDFIYLKLLECLFPPNGLLGAAMAIDVTFFLSSATSGGASSLPLPSYPQRSTRCPCGTEGPWKGKGEDRAPASTHHCSSVPVWGDVPAADFYLLTQFVVPEPGHLVLGPDTPHGQSLDLLLPAAKPPFSPVQ